MKNELLRLKVVTIALIVIIVVILTLLVSCEKNQDFCWKCTYTETLQRQGYEIDSWTSTYDLCGKTREEILKYDADKTKAWYYFLDGEKYFATTKCHCMKYTCW